MSKGFGRKRPMMGINIDTGVTFTTRSLNDMADIEFGLDDILSHKKVKDHADNGTLTPNGNFLYFLSSPTGLVVRGCSKKRPVLRIDINTGIVIQYYDTVADGARYVKAMELGMPETSLTKVACHIIRCCKGHQGCRSAYGFRWRYVEHDEPPENVPLPEPDHEGL